MSIFTIDAHNLPHRELNEKLRAAVFSGKKRLRLTNVLGQRFIAAGFQEKDISLEIVGTAGNDLAVFMDGPEIRVMGNGEDAVGNTMSGGRIVVFGDCGDLLGHSIRGGQILVRGSIGWRGGIHAKAYRENYPVIVVGGCAGDYLGEYLAGGLIIVLGLQRKRRPLVGKFTGTGMHGGAIYLRGDAPQSFLGREVTVLPVDDRDRELMRPYLAEFCREFKLSPDEISGHPFVKLVSQSSRPYGRLYAY